MNKHEAKPHSLRKGQNKIHKKYLLIIFAIFIGLYNYFNTSNYNKYYVKKNVNELTQVAEKIISSEDYLNITSKYKRFRVIHNPALSTQVVWFEVSSSGFGSQTVYKGFYYSKEDKPAVEMGNEELIELLNRLKSGLISQAKNILMKG